MTGTIRSANLEDVVRIVQIENDCFESPWEPEVFLGIVSRGGKMQISSRSVMVYIKQHNNLLVGYIVWTIDIVQKEGHILNLAIQEAHRGKGFAKDLMRFVFDSMQTEGIITCVLEVRASNTEAIGLYESFGMVPTGRIYEYYSNQEDAILYKVEL